MHLTKVSSLIQTKPNSWLDFWFF